MSFMNQVSTNLLEKENLLDKIKAQQKNMQEELMGMMKAQYESKVSELQQEMSQMEAA